MTERFVSHSFNYEDVLLRRLFRDRPTGFYIDVGAADPVDGSDTYMLHRRGWRGINVEPNPDFFRALEQMRPTDRNLNLTLSDRDGSLEWFRVGDTGLSTCDAAQADRAAGRGHVVTRHTVRTTTLARALEEARPPSIDLLKVDVEGLEPQVLAGNDWDRWRPSVIVVEATLPETPERRVDEIRPYLEQRAYRRVHFDGLNDWFVEASFAPPPDAFLPPNVFDGFVLRAQAELETRAAALGQDLERARAALADATEDTRRSRAEAASALERQVQLAASYEKALLTSEALRHKTVQLRAELENETARLRSELEVATRWRMAIEGSTSWRLTRPFRGLMELLRGH